jgi:hypothetical protein
MKSLIVFALDDTFVESKSNVLPGRGRATHARGSRTFNRAEYAI